MASGATSGPLAQRPSSWLLFLHRGRSEVGRKDRCGARLAPAFLSPRGVFIPQAQHEIYRRGCSISTKEWVVCTLGKNTRPEVVPGRLLSSVPHPHVAPSTLHFLAVSSNSSFATWHRRCENAFVIVKPSDVPDARGRLATVSWHLCPRTDRH